jgi:hypothetical protein
MIHRLMTHSLDMGTRDRFPDPQGHHGVETVLFNSSGVRLGKIGSRNFDQQWASIRDMVYRGKHGFLRIIHAGGGTAVMTGYNIAKNLHFELHGGNGNAWYDST